MKSFVLWGLLVLAGLSIAVEAHSNAAAPAAPGIVMPDIPPPGCAPDCPPAR